MNNDFWHATRFTRARQSFFEKRECRICSRPNKNPAGFHHPIIPGAMNHPEERNFRLIQSTQLKKHREEKALEPPLKGRFSRVHSPLLLQPDGRQRSHDDRNSLTVHPFSEKKP
ncbi:hypothetical protein ABGM91_08195 [Akkermansia muciniphila]|uniref:hypothetical protein n=1 Tax=Akkermansia muciniphila TaxID=239935 RepID=UPI0033BD965F